MNATIDHVSDAEMSKQIRKDFMWNKDAFAVNRYCGVNLSDDLSICGDRLAYVSRTGKMPDKDAQSQECERRLRMLAQQAMTLRTCKVINALKETAITIEPHGAFPWEGIRDAISKMPPQCNVHFVLNRHTASKVSFLDTHEWVSGERVPTISIEESVFVGLNGIDHVVPNGIVFLLGSEDPAGHNSEGLTLHCFEPDAFEAETHVNLENRVCLRDRFKVSVNGHCYQFKV